MAQAALTWTAAGGSNSLSQDVQYKLATSSTWITHSNVGPSVGSATITGLDDNKVYDFRVVNNCSVGGPTAATLDSAIKFVCPTVTLTPLHNQVSYSFTHSTATSIVRYVIQLLSSSDVVIASVDNTTPGATVSGTFTGLNPSTTYKVRVTMYTASNTFSNQCSSTTTATTAAPTCDPPEDIVAEMS